MLMTSGHMTALLVMTMALNGWQWQSNTPYSTIIAERGMQSKVWKVWLGLEKSEREEQQDGIKQEVCLCPSFVQKMSQIKEKLTQSHTVRCFLRTSRVLCGGKRWWLHSSFHCECVAARRCKGNQSFSFRNLFSTMSKEVRAAWTSEQLISRDYMMVQDFLQQMQWDTLSNSEFRLVWWQVDLVPLLTCH